ncbi:ATP-binding protein [Streptomyces sp. TBY4]|uniref:ATP-binding protein n=1 Tax=Streptomyces sp. TBY4 TaxID=2962030 RepID=UPI0020B6F42F|nr:ATP-binding protein [Streptomyces sp. TBY4]MCP3754389.1 ATP-binding protein [Streptomyces sp. TBY4]
MREESTGYDASQIQVLEGWEAVRKRPGMYIGSTDERGLRTMVLAVAELAVNEVLAGRAGTVEVTLTSDGGVRVTDDGPGRPLDGTGGTGAPRLEALLTTLRAGARPAGRNDVMLDLCGTGPFVVNALSRRMTAEVRHERIRWIQEYARGVAVTPPTTAGTAPDSGTTITFWPDPDIFGTTRFSFDTLAERFRELAFLNRALDLSLTDRRHPGEPRSARFHFPGGARDFVTFLDTGTAAPALTETLSFELEAPRMAGTLEVAFRWSDSPAERLHTFANSHPTSGGTHELGFRDGVAATINAYTRKRLPVPLPLPLPTETAPALSANRIAEGLTAVVSVKLDHPELQGPTRGTLGNPLVRTCVQQAVQEHLAAWLEQHPKQATALIARFQAPRQHR